MKRRMIVPSFLLTCLAITLSISTVGHPMASTDELVIQPYKVINAPRRFILGAGDKTGYSKDYGITKAFDFSLATNLLAAVIEESGGPTRLYIFDLEAGNIKHESIISNNPHAAINAVKLSPDGGLVAVPTGRDNEITLWNASTGTVIDKKRTDGVAYDVDWHPTGTSLAVAAGKSIEIWNVNSSSLERQRFIPASRGEYEWPMSARWSSDGGYLAIGTNGGAVYIDKGRAQSPALSPRPAGNMSMVEWNAAGDRIAAGGTGNGSTISVWSYPKAAVDSPFATDYQLISTFAPSQGQTWGKMTWDPSGEILAFGDNQSNFFFWDVSSGQLLKTYIPHPRSKPIEAHWKGNYLVTVGAYPDKDFRIWKVVRNSKR